MEPKYDCEDDDLNIDLLICWLYDEDEHDEYQGIIILMLIDEEDDEPDDILNMKNIQ